MRSLYLILAAAAVVVTCEPQHSNNDIIWYPVDEEEGVFISLYGEKHRTSPGAKWRSHRRARYSGMEPFALSYDTTENRDPSFFHDINERRFPVPQRVPQSFQSQTKRPQGQGNSNSENFQEIINEVFNYNKYPPASEYPGNKPAITNPWGNRPGTTSQWGSTSNNQWGSSKPTNSEWISTNKPSSRPTNQSDKLIFPDELSLTTTTPSNLVPTDPPTMSPCERICPVTPEFNPVCGSDGVTYSNAGRLKCANMCGKNVRLSHYGNCGRTPFVTPLVSKTPKQKFSGFWLVDK